MIKKKNPCVFSICRYIHLYVKIFNNISFKNV